MAPAPTRPPAPTASTGSLACLLAGTLLLTGCSGGSPGAGRSPGPRATATGSANSVHASASGGHGGSVGTFTAAFARCMRAHGVPHFPDPNGQSGQLGPDSGVDPGSPTYLAALNGPCRSLAPPAWLDSSSGPGSVPGN